METKKHQKFELKKNSALYFSVGLVAVLLLAYVALEWKTFEKTPEWSANLDKPDTLPDEMVPVTKFEPPKPKPIQTPPVIEIAPDDEKIVETLIESTEPNQDTEVADISDIEVATVDEPEIIPFSVIENAPTFPGCETLAEEKEKKACFQEMMQKHIQRHFKYPEMAQEMGLQGRVHIVFTIQKDGSIADVRMRGPHEVLEKEAERIISKLPKMTPGKQRGTPVKVPFSIPITFKLN
ncbi:MULTISPECIES: energy transducer TonB [Flavobacteriaceae]|uniref:energy transducer TonB n=1 Tax=Flavobacteriaceae TaxID=49546 RepID=UPI001491222B|nr:MULTISPECIES: energy transducer TonB [Allomuricauda]MDC6365785.1 TonB family protein [Muricauda sp. AC10]